MAVVLDAGALIAVDRRTQVETGDTVLTSDPGDLAGLLRTRGVAARLESV